MESIDLIIEALPEEERESTKKYLEGLNPIAGIDSKEKASEFIDKNEHFLKAKDSFISKANEAYSENHFKKAVDKEVKVKIDEYIKEKDPKETPEQKLIRELQEKDKARDEKDFRRDQKEILLEKSIADKLPAGLNFDLMIGDDEEGTLGNYESVTKPFLDVVKELTEKIALAEANTGMLKTGKSFDNIPNPFLEPQDLDMQSRLYKEDKKLYDKLLAESKKK